MVGRDRFFLYTLNLGYLERERVIFEDFQLGKLYIMVYFWENLGHKWKLFIIFFNFILFIFNVLTSKV